MPGRTIIEVSIEKDIKPKTNLTKCVNVNAVPKKKSLFHYSVKQEDVYV